MEVNAHLVHGFALILFAQLVDGVGAGVTETIGGERLWSVAALTVGGWGLWCVMHGLDGAAW